MSDAPHALVIDSDQVMRDFIADALSTFEPGFRVSTATDLDSAARRATVEPPDIVIARVDAFEVADLEAWFKNHRPDMNGVMTVVSADSPPTDATTVVTEPVSLTRLLLAARGLIAEDTEYARAFDDSADLMEEQVSG